MSSFQRMVVIPQEEYSQLSTVQNVRQPLTQQFYKLENEYNNKEFIEDPYRKLMMQSETLQDMKELKDKMRSYLTISTPKPYRTRAQALFESMEQFLKFNERGEMLDDSNKAIDNSRVEDLIQHAVRDRRRLGTPTGWSNFVQKLKTHNVPRSLLNRDTLDELNKTSGITIKPEVKSRSRSLYRSPKARARDHAYLRVIKTEEKPKRKRKKSTRYPSAHFLKGY